MERREKEDEIWLSRTNSRLGWNPDSGGETVESTEEFDCSIAAEREFQRRVQVEKKGDGEG